jgi:hypothetical protein
LVLRQPDGTTHELSTESKPLSGPDETREASISPDGETWTSLTLADLEKTGLLAKNNDRDTSCLTWFEKWIERFGVYCSCHPGYVICIGPAILE